MLFPRQRVYWARPMTGSRAMMRATAPLALITGLATVVVGQTTGPNEAPRITLALPAGIDSAAAQISYFMSGSFGGYGGFIKTEKDRLIYDIEAAVENKPAIRIKVIAYFPGCEIVTLDIPVEPKWQQQELPCHALGTVAIHGQIEAASAAPGQPPVVEITYIALWSHQFFGIFDGPVVTVPVGTALPDSDGRFEVQLPDYARQNGLGDGVFQFVLRQAAGRDTSITLRPKLEVHEMDGLKVRSSYPSTIPFLAENP